MDILTDKRVNSRFSKFCERACYGTESTAIGINFDSHVQKISLVISTFECKFVHEEK
jgi:hypothetical protein